MLREWTGYFIECDSGDCCNRAPDGEEYSAWETRDSTRESAIMSGWMQLGDEWYCPEHWGYDENDKLAPC